MRRLIQLRIELESIPQPIEDHDSFVRIALDEGLQVETIRMSAKLGGYFDVEELHQRIRSAHGYWIRQTHLLNEPSIRAIVEERIKDGAVAIAELRGPQQQGGAIFFQEHGLEASSIRAVRPASVPLDQYPHPMLVPVDTETYPFGFRDPTLFKGVRSLVLQQANGIGCFGDAQPVLAIPASGAQLLDITSDLFVSGIPRPELPVIASVSRADWHGRIVAVNAGIFHDPYRGPMGGFFPGISAADNEQFTRNLLRAVASGQRYSGPSWEAAFALIDDIETGIARLTESVLSELSTADWFVEHVPEATRTKCDERRSSEGRSFPRAAYLDLIDFKKIWKQSWQAFQPIVESVAPPASKSRSLAFMQEVNQIRNSAMHASKRFYAGLREPSATELETLRQHARLVAELQGVNRRRLSASGSRSL